MGCTSSTPKRSSNGENRKKRKKRSCINEVAIFVPALHVPMNPVEFMNELKGFVSRDVSSRLSSLRRRIVSLLEESDLAVVRDLSELQHALDEYLPFLLGLTMKEQTLESLVEFKWRMLEEDEEETSLPSAWFEVLSIVNLMATLSLVQANAVLVPKKSIEECEGKESEDPKKVAVDLLLKASGCLDYCVRHIMVNLPIHIRQKLPINLQEGVLDSISIQALAQGIELQLGLALECEKATLSVKRRLACEAVSYYSQAHYSLTGCYTGDGCGRKLLFFIQWKYLEAKAAAYYYHGLILDKGNSPSDHVGAVCCLFGAEEFLRDSKRACLSFCLATPVTRVPPVWGVMKHLNKKIPETSSKKAQMYGYLFEQDTTCKSLPDLPEFQLSLQPDDYSLPDMDASWELEKFEPQIQSLKEHLKDEEDDVQTA